MTGSLYMRLRVMVLGMGITAMLPAVRAQTAEPPASQPVSPARHLEETKSLVRESAIEKIAEGLRMPKPQDPQLQEAWRTRTTEYLRMASQMAEPRLAQALIELYEREPKSSFSSEVLSQLSKFNDPAVDEFCLRHLDVPMAFDLAVKRLGDRLPGKLAAYASEADSPEKRLAVTAVFSKLASFQPRAALRRAASEALTPWLTDQPSEVSTAAAGALALFIRNEQGNPDPALLGVVLKWIRTTGALPRSLQWSLTNLQHPEIGPVLLDWYRAHRSREHLWIFELFGSLRYVPALPEMIAEYQQRPQDRHFQQTILAAIAIISDDGAKFAYKQFKEATSLAIKVDAANALARARYADAFNDIRSLCEEVRLQGAWYTAYSTNAAVYGNNSGSWVEQLAIALVRIDPKAAMPYARRLVLLLGTEPGRRLSSEIQQATYRDQSLNNIQPDPPFPQFEELAIDPPKLPELDLLSWWRAVAMKRQDPSSRYSTYSPYRPPNRNDARRLEYVPTAPSPATGTDPVEALIAAGVPALEAMIEVCYPPDKPMDDKAVVEKLAALANPKTRGRAVTSLAIGYYSKATFENALASMQGEPRAIGEAILRWRGEDPWPVRLKNELHAAVASDLQIRWPLNTLQEFARANLARLAVVKPSYLKGAAQPLVPILASLRYSKNIEDIEKLAIFITTASETAALYGMDVFQIGLSSRTSNDLAPHWKEFPRDVPPLDFASMLRPERPQVCRAAMLAISMPSPAVRRKLRTFVANPEVEASLRRAVRSYLWCQPPHFGGGAPEDEKHYVATLASDNEDEFFDAFKNLIGPRAPRNSTNAYVGVVKKILKGNDERKRNMVLGGLSSLASRSPDDVPEVARIVAPLLDSPDSFAQQRAVFILRVFENASSKSVLLPLTKNPDLTRFAREKAEKLYNECELQKKSRPDQNPPRQYPP